MHQHRPPVTNPGSPSRHPGGRIRPVHPRPPAGHAAGRARAPTSSRSSGPAATRPAPSLPSPPGTATSARWSWTSSQRTTVMKNAHDLISWADVLIENFRPGVADRLGASVMRRTRSNSGLIYCSLPGFGEDSPHRNDRGWEHIVGAATGAHQGVAGMDEPLFLPLPSASNFAAIIAAVSVAMALNARQRTGQGQRIEVPLHSAMFAAMGRHLSNFHDINPPDLFHPPSQCDVPPVPVRRWPLCAKPRHVPAIRQPVPASSGTPRVDRRSRGPLRRGS